MPLPEITRLYYPGTRPLPGYPLPGYPVTTLVIIFQFESCIIATCAARVTARIILHANFDARHLHLLFLHLLVVQAQRMNPCTPKLGSVHVAVKTLSKVVVRREVYYQGRHSRYHLGQCACRC